jgi:hypothetical protein
MVDPEHQGCLTGDIMRHMKMNVRKYLNEMDRPKLTVRSARRLGFGHLGPLLGCRLARQLILG